MKKPIIVGILILILISGCGTTSSVKKCKEDPTKSSNLINVPESRIGYCEWNSSIYYIYEPMPPPHTQNKYFGFKILKDVDIKTFIDLGDSSYAIDKNNVYYNGEKIEGADPKKFVVPA